DGPGLPPRRPGARLVEQGPHGALVEPGRPAAGEDPRRPRQLGAGRRLPGPGHAAGLRRRRRHGAAVGADRAEKARWLDTFRGGSVRGARYAVREPAWTPAYPWDYGVGPASTPGGARLRPSLTLPAPTFHRPLLQVQLDLGQEQPLAVAALGEVLQQRLQARL